MRRFGILGDMQHERRHSERSEVATDVYLDVDGTRLRGRALNLSPRGVFIAGVQPQLEAGRVVDLVFPVPVQGMIRLHRKRAVVAHASPRGIGMRMEPAPRPLHVAAR